MLQPDTAKNETKCSLAGEEACKAKRCLQSLRFLWRNSRENSHSPSVQTMKDLLQDSPQQHRNKQDDAQHDAQRDAAPLQGSDGESEVDGDDDDLDEEPVGANAEVGAESVGDHIDGEPLDDGDSVHQGRQIQKAVRVEDGHMVDAAGSGNESLLAETEVLGASPPTPPPSSESSGPESVNGDDGDMQDSQVGPNWLSQFYLRYGKFGKTENSRFGYIPQCVRDGDKKGMLEYIKETLTRGNDIAE